MLMYQKYTTEALILRGYERGEADKMFALFAREFGCIWARASAVRRENSRMRYALQRGSLAQVSLVRGVRGWRLVGATSTALLLSSNKSASATFTRLTELLERLVRGEGAYPYVFDTLLDAHITLRREPKETHPLIELVAVARILYALGYLSTESLGSALFLETTYSTATLSEARDQKHKLLSSVNRSLSETQL